MNISQFSLPTLPWALGKYHPYSIGDKTVAVFLRWTVTALCLSLPLHKMRFMLSTHLTRLWWGLSHFGQIVLRPWSGTKVYLIFTECLWHHRPFTTYTDIGVPFPLLKCSTQPECREAQAVKYIGYTVTSSEMEADYFHQCWNRSSTPALTLTLFMLRPSWDL